MNRVTIHATHESRKIPSPTASMTAFARHEAGTPWGALTWELRSVNHRYLDIALRLPEELRSLEPRCRELINARLARGKVDGTLRFQPNEAAAGPIEMNVDQVQRLLAAADNLRSHTRISRRCAPSTCCAGRGDQGGGAGCRKPGSGRPRIAVGHARGADRHAPARRRAPAGIHAGAPAVHG